jgi:hypothetical protein
VDDDILKKQLKNTTHDNEKILLDKHKDKREVEIENNIKN